MEKKIRVSRQPGGNKTIKHTAITRAGYEYQDLVGIEVLIRHYRDPGLFEWVKIESDDPTAKALDDVVALRKDGSVEYVQVKFTVAPEKYLLDWDWLLNVEGAGTSMLTKWSRSLERASSNGKIHSAQLKTNRVPDQEFARTLKNGKVDLGAVEAATRDRINAACGGPAKAEAFFEEFLFTGAMPDLSHFEE